MKKITILILALLAMIALSACATKVTSENSNEISGVQYEQIIFGVYAYHLKDPDTGVEYFVVESGHGTAICPRYNSDGSLYTEENP